MNILNKIYNKMIGLTCNIESNNNANLPFLSQKINMTKYQWLKLHYKQIFKGDNEKLKEIGKLFRKPYNINGIQKFDYKPSSNNKLGRVYQQGCAGLQTQSGSIRDLLCHDDNGNPLYWDVDIVNCHPELLLQIVKHYEFGSEKLDEYVHNREKHLQDVIDHHNCSWKQAKLLFIRMMYGGGIKAWFKEFKIQVKEPLPFVDEFQQEIKKICGKFFTHTDFARERKEAESKRSRDNSDGPVESTCVSYIVAEIENWILHILYRYYSKKFDVGVLCFDGLMIHHIDDYIIEDTFEECIQEVKIATGYDIKLETKSLKRDKIDWKQLKEKFEATDFDKSELDHIENFDPEQIGNITDEFPMRHYAKMKYVFEKTCMYLQGQDCYYIWLNGELKALKPHVVANRMASVKTTIPKDNRNNYRFMDYYINEDTERKVYHDIDWIPYDPIANNVPVLDHYINTFKPWGQNIIPEDEIDDTIDYLKPLKEHLLRLCESNPKLFRIYVSFLHYSIRYPELPIHKLIVMISKEEGIGKSIIASIIKNITNDTNTRIFEDGFSDFLTRFSDKTAFVKWGFIDELKQNKSESGII